MKKETNEIKKDKILLALFAMKERSSLRGAGYSASEVRGAGYSASEVRDAGYSASELIGAGYSAVALRGAGYSASEVRGAGYSAVALRGAGYSASEVLGAGYSAVALRGAGYSASEVLGAGYSAVALRGAGYSASEVDKCEEIPVLDKPYSRMWADIQTGARIHNQNKWCDGNPETNLCGTPMCTAGHLVHMAGEVGRRLKEKYDWAFAASMIHFKTHPNYPIQDFGPIPQERALAYIELAAHYEETGINFFEPKKD